MPERRAAFCAETSLENAESLHATASRVDHWILVEYRGLWGHDAVAASGLSNELKAHLREQRDARPNTKLLFLRRPHRRAQPTLAVIWGSSTGRTDGLFHAELESYDDLLGLDFAAPGRERLAHPLLLVCTHGKHDRCCARYGRPLYKALEGQAEDDWVWQSSHVGGDRFAGNLVVLPRGLYYGGLDAESAQAVADATARGEVLLDHFRGRSDLPMGAQAADIELRRHFGLTGLDDVRATAVRVDGDLTTARFDLAGHGAREVVVRRVLGEDDHRLTCSARRAGPVPRHEVVQIADRS
jgi:hypothetical protein